MIYLLLACFTQKILILTGELNTMMLKQIKEGGDIRLFITPVPNVFNNIFFFVGLTTLGALIEF